MQSVAFLKSGKAAPAAAAFDYAFQRYGWTYWDIEECPEWLWEELSVYWRAEGDVQAQRDRPQTVEGKELIQAAKAQGFDLPEGVG